MKILAFLWRRLSAAISTLLLLLILLVLFIGYRLGTREQTDDAAHLAGKREYLQQVGKTDMSARRRPNIVFILFDDMGYGDIGAGAAGSAMINTPHIDQLAANGVMLSDFHSPSPVCTPSRAGYLTGRLAPRAGLPNLVFPSGNLRDDVYRALFNADGHVRLPAEEITLADLLKAAGYATGMVGKWHLGDHSPSLPNDMGFDSYFGAHYSNDMKPFALFANRDIAVPAPADQTLLTERYTHAATAFIEQHADRPFFLYFAHNFPTTRWPSPRRGAVHRRPGSMAMSWSSSTTALGRSSRPWSARASSIAH